MLYYHLYYSFFNIISFSPAGMMNITKLPPIDDVTSITVDISEIVSDITNIIVIMMITIMIYQYSFGCFPFYQITDSNAMRIP